MKGYSIRVVWLTNDWVTCDRVYDYTNKPYEFIQKEFDLISNQMYGLMSNGKIKTYTVEIVRNSAIEYKKSFQR